MTSGNPRKLAGIILAAGGSRRLGRPKQMIQWQGKVMLCRAVEACLPVCDAGLVVVTGACAAEVETCLKPYPVTIVRNPDWANGVSGSLQAGLAALRQFSFSGLLLSLGDQPLITPADVASLADAWATAPERPAAAYYNGLRGVPAIFPAAFRSELMALNGDQGARSILRAVADCSQVAIPTAATDIDTPADLEALLAGHGQENKGSDQGMKNINVAYFAVLRERAGVPDETVETQAETAADLYAQLKRRHDFPELASLKVAINDEFGDWDAVLRNGDSVVFIPPVAGG